MDLYLVTKFKSWMYFEWIFNLSVTLIFFRATSQSNDASEIEGE